LLLTEKGGGEIGTDRSCAVTAVPDFHFIGTMNPGGDYGKKEVGILAIMVVHSPAHTHTGIMDERARARARACVRACVSVCVCVCVSVSE
jgi:hypothetical protein